MQDTAAKYGAEERVRLLTKCWLVASCSKGVRSASVYVASETPGNLYRIGAPCAQKGGNKSLLQINDPRSQVFRVDRPKVRRTQPSFRLDQSAYSAMCAFGWKEYTRTYTALPCLTTHVRPALDGRIGDKYILYSNLVAGRGRCRLIRFTRSQHHWTNFANRPHRSEATNMISATAADEALCQALAGLRAAIGVE